MAYSSERKGAAPPSIYEGLPFRVLPTGTRAYDAEFYLRRVAEREDEAKAKAYAGIGIAENGTAQVVDGKIIYSKGKSG